MSALAVKYLPLASLTPYARNSRTHSDTQIAQIAASIKEFGFTNPVLVDASGEIIAGHGRVMAAQSLGMDSAPTICLGHLTATQRRAYVIADNKLALNAGWDEELLLQEVSALDAEGFELDAVGFDAIEIAELFAKTANDAQKSSASEIDTDSYQMAVMCPRCAFEFDPKK